jgi:ribonuclease HIII
MSQTALFPPAAGHIGTDESGKGDFFGPLVIAGFFCPEGQAPVLTELGVRDSKTLSDKKIRDLAETLRAGYVHSIVAIGPEKYNDLYGQFHNLNKLLAWGHARVIENILERVDASRAITDQFGDERFVLQALMKKGRRIELLQRPRGESDPAVAAASILARAEFVKRLAMLSRQWEVDLHKGAGPPVETAAAVFLARHGTEALGQVAKLHFKTAARVLGRL